MEKNKPSRAKKTSIPKMTERRNCHMRIFLKILDLGSSHSPFLPLQQRKQVLVPIYCPFLLEI
jgi:hypothetical protein